MSQTEIIQEEMIILEKGCVDLCSFLEIIGSKRIPCRYRAKGIVHMTFFWNYHDLNLLLENWDEHVAVWMEGAVIFPGLPEGRTILTSYDSLDWIRCPVLLCLMSLVWKSYLQVPCQASPLSLWLLCLGGLVSTLCQWPLSVCLCGGICCLSLEKWQHPQ